MRERKRQERHDDIIAAAIQLFQSKGYEQTTMEDIAAHVDVSPPTLYRYFPTKAELLLALFWKTRQSRAPMLEDFHAKSSGWGAVEAMAGLIYLNNSGISSQSQRKMWREVMAALLRIHDVVNDEFKAYKRRFEEHIERMLKRLRKESLLSKEVPVEAMVAVLYAVAAENFNRIIANEFSSAAEEKAAVETQVGAVLRGWIPAVKATSKSSKASRQKTTGQAAARK